MHAVTTTSTSPLERSDGSPVDPGSDVSALLGAAYENRYAMGSRFSVLLGSLHLGVRLRA